MLQGFTRRVIHYTSNQVAASTLVNEMSMDNVVQLCGNENPAVRLALKHLRQGDVIAVPTDTVYGLAVDSGNSAAIGMLYKLKGREEKKPLAICLGSVEEVKMYGNTDFLPKGLIKTLLPGPVTILITREDKLNPDLNPGVKLVGIRVPEATQYPFVQNVASALGRPLALTSANLSNEPNCINIREFKSLWPKIGMIFSTEDISNTRDKSREASTIVDLSEKGKFSIRRHGVGYMRTLEILKHFGLEEIS